MASGIPLPGRRWRRILTTASTYDAAILIVSLPAALVAAWKLYSEGFGWWFFVACALVAVFAVVKIVVAIQKDPDKGRLNALDGALHTLHAVLKARSPLPDPRLRLTIHKPDGEDLIQVMEYVGDQRALLTHPEGTAGRRTRANCGIIGKALQSKERARGHRQQEDFETYVTELIQTWHYDKKEAHNLNPSSMSWLAIPLIDNAGKVLAILFADSVRAGFFTDEIVEVANDATTGIAEFVSSRMN